MYAAIKTHTGPEEFVNLQGPLVQSSNLFDISSVQFSSLGTSLSGKFVHFRPEHRGQVPPFSSVQFIPLSSRTLPTLTRTDLADLQGLLVQSADWFGLSSVQLSSIDTSCLDSWFGAPVPSASVQFAQFSSFSSIYELLRPNW